MPNSGSDQRRARDRPGLSPAHRRDLLGGARLYGPEQRSAGQDAAAETTSRNFARATPVNPPAVASPPEPVANPS